MCITRAVGLTLASEDSGSLVKLLFLSSPSHWSCRMSENKKERVQEISINACRCFAHVCTKAYLQLSVYVCPLHYTSLDQGTTHSLSVHHLTSRTWMAWLTLAPDHEDSRSLAKLQPMHMFPRLQCSSYWGCRMSENEMGRGSRTLQWEG